MKKLSATRRGALDRQNHNAGSFLIKNPPISTLQYGSPPAQKFNPSGIDRRSVSHVAEMSPDAAIARLGAVARLAMQLFFAGNYALGEELTNDYATSTGDPGFTMPCRCGATECRGTVTGEDWRLPQLQERYGGHWVPVLLARIRAHGGNRAAG